MVKDLTGQWVPSFWVSRILVGKTELGGLQPLRREVSCEFRLLVRNMYSWKGGLTSRRVKICKAEGHVYLAWSLHSRSGRKWTNVRRLNSVLCQTIRMSRASRHLEVVNASQHALNVHETNLTHSRLGRPRSNHWQ